MNPWVIVVLLLVLICAIVAFGFLFKNNKKTQEQPSSIEVQKDSKTDLTIKFEELPYLTEVENASLVEIEDKQLLARIDNAIPGTLQAIAKAGAAAHAGNLYHVILPAGMELAKAKGVEGAYRGFARGAKVIEAQPLLIPAGKGLAALKVADSAMGIAAVVVGQYYMTQINEQLGEINKVIDKIAAFQDREYLSKLYAIIAEIQTCSQFRLEIIDNEEQRNRELDHLKSIEHECAELLGQANLTLKDFEKKAGLSYSDYEKLVIEAEKWYQYQQILLQLIQKTAELTYTLYLGGISKEHCYSKVLPYVKQADDALASVEAWHKKNCKSFEIDLEAGKRHRQGFDDVLHFIPSLFDDNHQYRRISRSTVKMISSQSSGQSALATEGSDLYRENVRLIAKDGKLYYLPQDKEATQNGDV